MRSVEDMAILLCVVEERVVVTKLEKKRVSDGGFLVDVHVTMLTLWEIERHLIGRSTVLLHSPCLRIKKKPKEPVVEVSVDGITTKVLIDYGSVSNLMGMDKCEELNVQGLNTKIEHCYKRLYAYGGKELEVIGQVQVDISFRNLW